MRAAAMKRVRQVSESKFRRESGGRRQGLVVKERVAERVSR